MTGFANVICLKMLAFARFLINIIKKTFSVENLMLNKKYLFFLVLVLLFLAYHFGKIWIIQQIYGVKTESAEELSLAEKITMLPQEYKQTASFGKYEAVLSFRAEYQVWGRAAYVDIYDKSFYFGFKSRQQVLNTIYNAVSPLDISLFIGQTAADGNWQKIKVTHEYRVVRWKWSTADKVTLNKDEISNSHVIPASTAIRRGFDTISKGDIVYMKGFLLDWNPVGEFADIDFKTALTAGEIADFKLGGRISGLCRYFYVTELAVKGYLFK